MVARGEIGLLIIQIGLNQTPFMSETAFITAAWAIVLNTIIGPVAVGVLLGKLGKQICDDPRWGTQSIETEETVDNSTSSMEEVKPGRQWTSRRHSRSVSYATSSRDASRVRSVYHSRAPSGSHQINLERSLLHSFHDKFADIRSRDALWNPINLQTVCAVMPRA